VGGWVRAGVGHRDAVRYGVGVRVGDVVGVGVGDGVGGGVVVGVGAAPWKGSRAASLSRLVPCRRPGTRLVGLRSA
jgi:hypothetical protein